MAGDTFLIGFMGVLILGQWCVIYGLVNRLIMQAGMRKLQPKEAIDLNEKTVVPVPKPRPISGSHRIGI